MPAGWILTFAQNLGSSSVTSLLNIDDAAAYGRFIAETAAVGLGSMRQKSLRVYNLQFDLLQTFQAPPSTR